MWDLSIAHMMSKKFIIVSLRETSKTIADYWQDGLLLQLGHCNRLGLCQNLLLPHVPSAVQAIQLAAIRRILWPIYKLGILYLCHCGNAILYRPCTRTKLAG